MEEMRGIGIFNSSEEQVGEMGKIGVFIKFLYLYLIYWFVGLDQEDFYISKANYFADLGRFQTAIKCYRKALKESETFLLYAAIGWCYWSSGEMEKALEYYRKAYEKVKRHDVAIHLAYLEMELGNTNNSHKVFENIKEKREALPEESLELYDEVRVFLGTERKAG